MSIAIDIAWSRPTVAQIQATGATGVLRYLSTDDTKNLHASEVTAYRAAGLGVGTVWETTTGRARQGYQAGIDDATLAEGQRAAVGLPADHPIYAAVDEDTDWASVEPYFCGFDVVLGKDLLGIPRTGTYGGFAVIEGAYGFGLRRLWQTLAWSGGRRSAHASLYQDGRTVLGGSADINQILSPDWGQYPQPEVDMPLTPADVQTLLNTTLTSPFRKDAAGKPAQISIATYFEYMDKHFDDTVALINSVKAQNVQLAAAVAALSAGLAKVAGGGVDPAVVAADVLKGLAAALSAAKP